MSEPTQPRPRPRLSNSIIGLVTLLSLLAPLQLPAQTPLTPALDDAQPLQIGSIAIDGLRKTDEEIVRNLIGVEAGDQLRIDTLTRIEAALVDSDLFADVQVGSQPSGTGSRDIFIVIDEKWTLIPIPFAATDGESLTGGLILLEANLLGLNKQLIGGAFGGSSGFTGFFVYVDPAVFQSRWFGAVSAATGRQENTRTTQDARLIRSYSAFEQSVGASIGYNISDDLQGDAGLGVEQWLEITETPGAAIGGAAPLAEQRVALTGTLGLSYDNTRALDVLRIGPDASVEIAYTLPDRLPTATLDSSLALGLFDGHRLRLLASGGIGEVPALLEMVISGRDGYRTLPFGSAAADLYGSTAAIYDLPVVRGSWGALVLSHYWEVGARRSDAIDGELFFGPGGGFRVYIRQLAIPALGLDVAYSVPGDNIVFSFSLGAQM